MTLRFQPTVLSIIASFLGLVPLLEKPTHAQQAAPGVFYCGSDRGSPATLVKHSSRGTVVVIRWTSDYFSGSGWSPQRRCEEISRRFQSNKEQGTLNYIISGTLNGLPVLCGSSSNSNGGTCSDETLLFTLKKQSDADSAIKEIARLNRNAAADPLNQGRQPVEVGRDGSLIINVDIFLMNSPSVNLRPGCDGAFLGECFANPTREHPSILDCKLLFLGQCANSSKINQTPLERTDSNSPAL